ncbi:xanthine dehydrogenase family protein molybdopterin-binding subunit [Tindallia californiensis]|uniref:CO or xanthine dehydrogenase, Mo-binding subunit n=1 Tax=Tindallia californiensis TaxID=159292 RepID=A0A1H3P6S6_9FIRM|nr:molybdopterin cofactor-binding domain-containing protein [Tindallia californiensis]SDY96771.1 CO or xanthine dehydrogenase, Mo-binding subunit [Tindallia californiensis]
MSLKIVKQSLPKMDGMSLMTGKAVYTDDMAPKDALVVKVLRSPHAHAKILAINKSRAEKVPGVVCILTHEDVIRKPFTRAGQSYPELSPHDKFLLDSTVRHVGDDVAIIAAENQQAAEKALKLIKVTYEALPLVLDMEKAEEMPPIHPEPEILAKVNFGFEPQRNIAGVVQFELGETDSVLADCEVVVRHTYQTQRQAQAMMETQRSFTYLDHYGRLVVVSSTQIPFHVRRILANALDMPASKIRVIKPRIGGGFGSKQTVHSEFYPALITMKTGRPAKIVYSRKEVFCGTTSRHGMTFEIALGATKAGMVKVIDMNGIWDTGAYGEHASTTLGSAGKKVLTLYNRVEACRFRGKAVYTNHVPGGALRGYGVTQGIFALESAMNELAHQLEMDPVSLREKNMIRQGETTPLYNMVTKGAGKEPMLMNSCMLETCVERGKELIDWEAKYPGRKIDHHRVRGVGMAISQQGSGLPNIDMAAASLKLNDDGFFSLTLGATDIGTGSDTILTQIAAEALGVSMDRIILYTADTDITPYDSGAYASSTTYTTGNAILDAAEKMVKEIIKTAALYFETVEENIDFDGEKIICRHSSESISLELFSQKITYQTIHQQLSVTGSFVPKKAAPPFMAGFAEVEVDLETGQVRVEDFVGVVDCGTPINPMLAKVQAEGGIVQGIGLALYEEAEYTEKGKLVQDTLMQYKIPGRGEIGNLRVELVEGFDDTGPYGAKSIGEVVVNTVAPAVTDAIYNACGVRIRELPATSEKVFKQIKKQME